MPDSCAVKGFHWQRTTRQVLVAIAGTLLLIAGVVMLITPGPGLLALAAGLAVWSTEFAWAERAKTRLSEWTKRRYGQLRGHQAELLGDEDDKDGDEAESEGHRDDDVGRRY